MDALESIGKAVEDQGGVQRYTKDIWEKAVKRQMEKRANEEAKKQVDQYFMHLEAAQEDMTMDNAFGQGVPRDYFGNYISPEMGELPQPSMLESIYEGKAGPSQYPLDYISAYSPYFPHGEENLRAGDSKPIQPEGPKQYPWDY